MQKKYLSVAVPCFNSSEYMRKCIDSIVGAGEDVEVLIVDDGSTKDDTFSIATEYEKKYPNICRAFHKENGGHGSVINFAIEKATGEFFRVVDSDDHLDTNILKELLEVIKNNSITSKTVDLYVTNFIYDKVDKVSKKEMDYSRYFPTNKIFTWDDTKKFLMGTYLLMHSMTYRLDILKKSGLKLPEHTFYVDNIFAYKPLALVEKMYYIDKPLYYYYIGRTDQSVNEKVMISRLAQQYKVTYEMIDNVDILSVKNKKQMNYMLSYLNVIMVITSILSILSNDSKWLMKKEEMWHYLIEKDIRLNNLLRFTVLSRGVNIPSIFGRKISKDCYKVVQMFYGFN